MCVNLGCADTKKLAAHKLLPLVVGLVQTHLHHLAVGIAELVKTDPVALLLGQVLVDFAEACTEALVIRYLFQNFLCSLPAVVASNDLKVVLREVAQQSFIGNIGLDVDDQRLVSGCWFVLHGSPKN